MKAAIVRQAGQTPIVGDFDDPQPEEGESTYTLIGAGIHQVVRSLAAGRHYGSTDGYPQIPGVDAVARGADGGLVYTGWIRSPWGTMAQQMAARFGIPIPDGADPLAIAAGINPASSGWFALNARRDAIGGLRTVWILGATGMSGRLATQEAKLLGAQRIITVGRNREILEQLSADGAETVALGTDDAATTLAATRDAGEPDLILDYVWGDVAEVAFDALQRRGLDEDDADISYVQIGSLAGPTAAVPSTLLRSRRFTLSGSGAGSLTRREMMAHIPTLIAHIASGELQVPYTAFPLGEINDAWSHTGSSRAVITP